MQLLPGFKQVLSREGWIDLEDYYNLLKKGTYEVLVIYKGHCVYSCPKSFSSTFYSGILTEVITDTSRVILKPSTKLMVESVEKKVSSLSPGERMNRYFSYQVANKREEVKWNGNIFSIFFGESVLLPIKFENDYILIPV